MLVPLALNGDPGARQERLLREVMSVDGCDYETAVRAPGWGSSGGSGPKAGEREAPSVHVIVSCACLREGLPRP